MTNDNLLPAHPGGRVPETLTQKQKDKLIFLGRSDYDKDCYWNVWDLEGETYIELNHYQEYWHVCYNARNLYIDVPA